MLVLADNDLILTLGACDLLDDLPRIFGIKTEQILVTPVVRHYMRSALRREQLVTKYSYAGIERAIAFASRASLLNEEAVDTEVLGRIVGIPRIDIGEATLLAALPNVDDGHIATGDKSFIRALASSDECDDLISKCEGRIFCLDQVVILGIRELGFGRVRACIAPNRECNGWFRIAFSGGLDTPEDHAIAAFESAIYEIKAYARGLLVPTH